VAQRFGARIAERAQQGEVAALRRRCPGGYLAVQCSAEFGDDATLDALAAQLAPLVAETGCVIVGFRAGAAPWHDDPDVLRRLATRLPPGTAQVFDSLDLWDLCALIAHGRAFVGSSLHGRIVATAFARPRVSLRPRTGVDKPGAYAATWELPALPGSVPVDCLAAALRQALAAAPAALQALAAELAQRHAEGFEAVLRALA